MWGWCPPVSHQPQFVSCPSARGSSAPSGCRPRFVSFISTTAVHCIGSSAPNRTHIRTIIPGLSKRPFFRAGMSRRFFRSFPTVVGEARWSSACRARVTGSRPPTSTGSSACRTAKVGRSCRRVRSNAKRRFGGLATRCSVGLGMYDGGAITGPPSLRAVGSSGLMMPGDTQRRPIPRGQGQAFTSISYRRHRGGRIKGNAR